MKEENTWAHLALPYLSVRPTDYLETLQIEYLSWLLKCSDENKAREYDPLEFTMATHIKSLFKKTYIVKLSMKKKLNRENETKYERPTHYEEVLGADLIF